MNTGLSARISLLHVFGLCEHSVPNHLTVPAVAFTHNPSARQAFWASPLGSRLADRPGRNGFVAYGLLAHFRLLSTSSYENAVTFCYRPECACLKRTRTSLTKHAYRRTATGVSPVLGDA